MTPETIASLNNAPDMQGLKMPDPPDSINGAFDEWLRRGGMDWEQDGTVRNSRSVEG